MDIFAYTDYRSYLTEARKQAAADGKPLSLDAWAKRLGYRSPRSIAMILNGQRWPTTEMLLAIAADFKLNATERRYLELLILKQKYESKGAVPEAVRTELESFQATKASRKELSSEYFGQIFQWHFLVLKQLIASGKCNNDIAWIYKKMHGKVSEPEIKTALDVMQKLNLIRIDFKENKILLTEDSSYMTKADIPSRYVQEHMKQQLEKSAEALIEHGIMDREFTCLTLRVNQKNIGMMKKAIREVRDKFDKEFATASSTEVAQLNIQFFFHTKGD